MKTACLLILLSLFAGSANGANYYFSSSIGDDSRSGTEAQNPNTPWKTIQKLNSFFSNLTAGDSVLFKRGETFFGSIDISQSGTSNAPIVLGSYGSGEKPILGGLITISGWTNLGGGIWQASLPASATTINMVVIDGKPKAMGRFPNYTTTNKGYLTIDSHSGSTQITDSDLPPSPNWTNAEVVIRKDRWTIERNLITQQSGSTLTYIPAYNSDPSDNFGYFIQNHPATLDEDGEWYFNPSNNTLRVYFGNNDPNTSIIKTSFIDTIITVKGKSNIVFDNLSFEGADAYAFFIQASNNLYIKNCDIPFSGADGLMVENTINLNLENVSISNTYNSAFVCYDCSGSSIRNSKIKNIGVFPGMGKKQGLHTGISMHGYGHVIEYNELDSIGYVPIDFSGDNITIKNNFINHFGFIKDDGAGIYTWNGYNPARYPRNRKITGNIILNGIGAGAGTNSSSYAPMHGIYMDDKTSNVEISDNTVANCGLSGIYLHNADSIIVYNNTLYNNYEQFLGTHDDIAPNDPIRALQVSENIFFSKTADQVVSKFETRANDIGLFGQFSDNYYCRPADEKFIHATSFVQNGSRTSQTIDFATWKTTYNLDLNSKTTPLTNPGFVINNLGADKLSNGAFDNNINGIDVWSQINGNCTSSWNSNKLNGGCLQVSFLSTLVSSNYVMIPIGSVEAGKAYTLNFTMQGSDENKYAQVFLRKISSPYTSLTNEVSCKITGASGNYEILLTATVSESNAYIIFSFQSQSSPVWLDNIRLQEADVTSVSLDDYVRFEYNPTKEIKSVSLDASYIDMKSNWYNGEITLAPYSSAILMKPFGLIMLPFKFINFSGVSNNKQVTLSWATANETAIDFFVVEASKDANEFSGVSSRIDKISEKHQYGYSQSNSLSGFKYYRIKAVSKNGNFSYSKIIKLDEPQSTSFDITPNPAKNTLVITLSPQHQNQGYVFIHSTSGALLGIYPLRADQSLFQADVSFLSKGIYVATVTCSSYVERKLFLKN